MEFHICSFSWARTVMFPTQQLATVFILCLFGADAAGQPSTTPQPFRSEYHMEHSFRVDTSSVTQLDCVKWRYFQHAYVTAMERAGYGLQRFYRYIDPQNYDTNPVMPDYMGFRDCTVNPGSLSVNQYDPVSHTNVSSPLGDVEIPQSGGIHVYNESLDDWVTHPPRQSSAIASSSLTILPFTRLTIQGTVGVDGIANTSGATGYNDAFAHSVSYLVLKGQFNTGTIHWQPQLANSYEGRGWAQDLDADPIVFVITDEDGNVIDTRPIWEFEIEKTADVYLAYDAVDTGLLTLQGEEGELTIALSEYTSTPGQVHLRFRDGIIIEALDDGIFDGLFPAVGEPADFSITMPDLLFDFDLNPGSNDLLNGFFVLGGSGREVPEPGTAVSLLVCTLIVLRSRTGRRRQLSR